MKKVAAAKAAKSKAKSKVKPLQKPPAKKTKEKVRAITKASTPVAHRSKSTDVPAKDNESAKRALAKEKEVRDTAPQATGPMAQKWTSLYRKSESIEAKPYNMRQAFNEKTAIVHDVLGWGYILANRNDRLEVLFKDGIRYLISNYK